MTRRPGGSDDDEPTTLPEVTVPPWLRTGPVADPSVAGAPPPPGAVGTSGAAETAGAPVVEPGATPAVAPTRITLGARAGEGAGPGPVPRGATADEEGPQTPRDPVPESGVDRSPDDLSTLPLRASAGAPGQAAGGASEQASADGGTGAGIPIPARRPVRIALAVAAGAAVLGGSAVLGFLVARGVTGEDPAPAVAAAAPGCEESVEGGTVTGSGPGSLDSPAGAVLAFDHAYYVDRSAERAFEAVAPSSRMTVEQLRTEGIERLAEGTAHCVRVSELAPTLLEVELTEFPPGAEPVVIRQRVRVAENPDGTWGIVSITPAG